MNELLAENIWQRLQVCIAGLLAISPEDVRPEMSLMEDLGIDSLDLIELAVLVKREFQVQIPIQNWMKGIASMAKALTPENLTEEINRLAALTGLEFSDASLAALRESLCQNATDFDQAREVVAMIKVETIHRLLLTRLATGQVDAEAVRDGAEPLEVNAETVRGGAEPLEVNAEPVRNGAEPLEVNAETVRDGAEPLEVNAKRLRQAVGQL